MSREGRLELVPMSRDDANEFVRQHHRHRGRVPGHKFALGAGVPVLGSIEVGTVLRIVGVAIVGRPVSRHLDNGWTLEVLRLCTDGHRNAPSFLYGASWRAARALGWRRLITYTLATEPGTSPRAAGWREVGRTRAQTWERAGRPRVPQELEAKTLWEVGA